MLKKHLKKIVSLVLVTMMAIGMSITAIAAEPYQNELEAVMDTSPADSGQVTHYDTTTGEMLVEDGELLTFDEVAIPVPKGSADTPSERGIEIYLVRAGIKKTSGGEFTWYFNVDCPTSPFVKPNIKLTAQLKGSFTTLSGSYSNVGGSVYYNAYTANTGVTLNRSLYDVHHIRPLAYGGSNAYSNLIHLPKATHTQVTSWWAGY